jgi:hypothetical protein
LRCRSDGGHIVYKRHVVLFDESGSGGDAPQVQTLTMSATPSDRRAWQNQLADLRRMDDGVQFIYAIGTAEEAQGAAALLLREMSRLNDLHGQKREMETGLDAVQIEIAEIESKLEDLEWT